MFKTSTKMLMMSTLILSTMIVISSENWFSMWMGLEINMISFITMMSKNKNNSSPEAKMIYFLIQSMSSIIMMFTIIMNPMIMNAEMFMGTKTIVLMSMAMFMKMGAAPMHTWFINIVNKMNWDNCLILMTWQKIAPMFILSNINSNNKLIMLMSMISAIMGAIGGLNQTSIKKIMAFSSVNHLGWMIICLKFDNEMWIKYWIIYTIIILMMTSTFKKKSTKFLNQMNLNMKTNMEKMNMIILLLSLGGLPPFIGFLPKWIVIQSLIQNQCMTEMLILMFTSMITLFYYMRIISPMIMSNNIINKWNTTNYSIKMINMMKLTINLMLPITMMINLI